MFIAHLPAGYLLTRRIEEGRSTSGFLWLGLCASLLPDLDMIWFYLVDHRQHLHHSYWTHIPFYWALLALGWFGMARLLNARRFRIAGEILFANILLHLLLDTMAGHIRWLAPLSDRSFALFDVKPHHSWWVLNFVLHGSFLFEVVIVAWGLWELIRDRTRERDRISPMAKVGSR